jgi:hypothetical protein
LSRLIHNCYPAKGSPNICTASVIFKTLQTVTNYPIGENSPILITLHAQIIIVFQENYQVIVETGQNRRKNNHNISTSFKMALKLQTKVKPFHTYNNKLI